MARSVADNTEQIPEAIVDRLNGVSAGRGTSEIGHWVRGQKREEADIVGIDGVRALTLRIASARLGWLAALLTLASQPVEANDLVRLQGWADEASVVNGGGTSGDLFALIAQVEWAASAPRDASRYQIQLAYPDGRVEKRSYPVEFSPGRRRMLVYVQASPLRDIQPSRVRVTVNVIDAATGASVSNTLEAGIDQFPRWRGDASFNDPGPFGYGTPLTDTQRTLPREAPLGLRFTRIPGSTDAFIANTEATVAQVGAVLKGYDPRAGRSDEFNLEDPRQPAINLKPAQARAFLQGLSNLDTIGLTYRLPTEVEWLKSARAGKTSAFWWGDAPTFAEGANFIGPEPALQADATAPSVPSTTSPSYKTNPIGLAHTFGNAAEWALNADGSLVRMGGHFRTEPASPLPVEKVEGDEQIGPDPFVGVRPALTIAAEPAAKIIQKALGRAGVQGSIQVAFDPQTATATLSGTVADTNARRAADRALGEVWFVAAVVNQLSAGSLTPGQLAILGPGMGRTRKVAVLDHAFLESPISVRWLDPLPVVGSTLWLNVYYPGGSHFATKVESGEPGRSSRLLVRVDRGRLAALGQGETTPVTVALSLGAPAPGAEAGLLVSNRFVVTPRFSK